MNEWKVVSGSIFLSQKRKEPENLIWFQLVCCVVRFKTYYYIYVQAAREQNTILATSKILPFSSHKISFYTIGIAIEDDWTIL